MRDFVHLHVHTQYSILDGQASITKLVDKAIADGMKGMAITDHGNMYGIKEFFNYTQKINAKAGENIFKPIFGCEMYVARAGMASKNGREDQGGNHLVVLAKNQTGYHNLVKLVSHSWVDGFYSKPRTDHAELEKYHEGLIVSSACIAGEIPSAILKGDMEKAEETVKWYKSVFGDDYYLELQRHKADVPNANHETFPLQQRANEGLVKLSKKLGVKLICTNDVHFVDEENAEAHDRLICLSTGRDLDDPKRMLYSKQEWFKTREEMTRVFEDHPEAMANTCEILDKVEFYSIDHEPIMPNFAIPEEFGTEEEYKKKFSYEDLFEEFSRDEKGNVIMSHEKAVEKIERLGDYDKLIRIKFEAEYLRHLTYIGAHKRYGDVLDEELTDRIDFELHIMKTMGFPGYFLIVQDFIRAAREELGVSVGPGRGSAAGSVVAYCLWITQIDPIKYDLLFERFLNPDRISLPDIDVDFDDDGRGKVLEWVTQKYGEEKVAHIITYGTMAAKMAIKDVARVQKLPLSESDRLCKLIPDRIPNKKINLKNAIEYVPELRQAEVSADPVERDTIKYAKMLEGNVRNIGVHACGTIICRDDISDWVPVCTVDDKSSGGRITVTQYEGSVIEDTGLIKMDFLGLKTLSIIKEAVENIRISKGINIDIDSIDIDDPATYRLYSEGNTIGTFQFESAGMQKYLRQLNPSTFEDLIAMNALYRPGPMDYIPDFIARKKDPSKITYDIPCMEKYLKDTYGITVYQEQVMLLSRQLAGFTRGQSDTLRKAMGKKKIDQMNKLEGLFYEGGVKNGHDKKILNKIWEDWKKFASYAFNKSHATCYSWVAFQTAYLKANYPAEYMAATMSRNISDITEITKLMDESRSMGINTLGPNVNESYKKFSVNHRGDIRFGLGAVKGLGDAAVGTIIQEREENGPYKGIFDFIERLGSKCGRRNLECLALSGAFDQFPEISREDFFFENSKGEIFSDSLIKYGNMYQEDKQRSTNTLFGDLTGVGIARPEIPSAPKWSDLERLGKEKELVGIYLSAHPLDEYSVILNDICNAHMEDLDDLTSFHDKDLIMGGIVTGVRTGISKNGNPYGFVKIEDFTGSHEFGFFAEDWLGKRSYFVENTSLLLRGKCQPKRWNRDDYDIWIGSVDLLPNIKDSIIEKISINIPLNIITDDMAAEMKDIIQTSPGNVQIQVNIYPGDSVRPLNMNCSARISVKKRLTDYLKSKPGITYSIN